MFAQVWEWGRCSAEGGGQGSSLGGPGKAGRPVPRLGTAYQPGPGRSPTHLLLAPDSLCPHGPGTGTHRDPPLPAPPRPQTCRGPPRLGLRGHGRTGRRRPEPGLSSAPSRVPRAAWHAGSFQKTHRLAHMGSPLCVLGLTGVEHGHSRGMCPPGGWGGGRRVASCRTWTDWDGPPFWRTAGSPRGEQGPLFPEGRGWGQTRQGPGTAWPRGVTTPREGQDPLLSPSPISPDIGRPTPSSKGLPSPRSRTQPEAGAGIHCGLPDPLLLAPWEALPGHWLLTPQSTLKEGAPYPTESWGVWGPGPWPTPLSLPTARVRPGPPRGLVRADPGPGSTCSQVPGTPLPSKPGCGWRVWSGAPFMP